MAFFNRSPRPDGAWRFFFIILVPILFCWVPFLSPWYPTSKNQMKMVYILLVHGLYWTTNVIPFVITGFIGIVMLPLLGIAKAKPTAETFMREQTAFLLGQFLLAGVIISTGVTHKVALKFLSISGHQHDRMISLLFISSYLLAMITTSGISALVMCDLALWVLKARHAFHDEPRMSDVDDLHTRFLFKTDPDADVTSLSGRSKEDGEDKSKDEGSRLTRKESKIMSLKEEDGRNETKDGEEQGKNETQASLQTKNNFKKSNEEEKTNGTKEEEEEGKNKTKASLQKKNNVKKSNQGPQETKNEKEDDHNKTQASLQKKNNVRPGKVTIQKVSGVPNHLIPGKVPEEPEAVDSKGVPESQNKYSMIEFIDYVSNDHQNLMISLKRQYVIVVYTACNIGGLLFPFGTLAAQFLYSVGDDRLRKFKVGSNKNQTYKILSFTKNGSPRELDLALWTSYVLPIMLIFGIIAYIYVLVWNMKIYPLLPSHRKLSRKRWMSSEEQQELTYEQEYYSISHSRFVSSITHGWIVGGFMLAFLILCLTRDPRNFQGWSRILWKGPKGKPIVVEESAIAFLLVILMSAMPRFSRVPNEKQAHMPVFNWSEVVKMVMWNVVMLHGGQSVLAEGVNRSRLGADAVRKLETFAKQSPSIYPWLVIISASVFTEVLGSVTAGDCFGTVLTFIGHPFSTAGLPAAVMSSLSFMFPVATPANVIALIAAGYDLRIYNMMAYGFALDIMAIIVVGLYHTILGRMGFLDFPL